MAYAHSFDADRKLILVVQSEGENYYKEMLDWMMAVRTDPAFSRGYGILCDFRDGTVQLSPTDAFTCGTILQYFFAGQKVAFVIPDGLKPMVEKQVLAVHTALEVRGFALLQDAENWLSSGGRSG